MRALIDGTVGRLQTMKIGKFLQIKKRIDDLRNTHCVKYTHSTFWRQHHSHTLRLIISAIFVDSEILPYSPMKNVKAKSLHQWPENARCTTVRFYNWAQIGQHCIIWQYFTQTKVKRKRGLYGYGNMKNSQNRFLNNFICQGFVSCQQKRRSTHHPIWADVLLTCRYPNTFFYNIR